MTQNVLNSDNFFMLLKLLAFEMLKMHLRREIANENMKFKEIQGFINC